MHFRRRFAYLKSVTRGTPKLTIPSPSMMHNSLTLEEQTAKLRLVAQTAREIWG